LTKFYAAVAAGVSCQKIQKIQKSQAHVPTYFCTKTSTSSPPEQTIDFEISITLFVSKKELKFTI